MRLTIVVARAANGVIGRDNALPWHVPEDLAHFKRVTLGKPIIMGRRTFDSIGRPLPGRRNIVVTRNAEWRHDGCERASSLDDAMRLCAQVEEACVIGGAQLFIDALARAHRAIVTEIAADIPGDTYFPALGDAWREISREPHRSADGLAFDFVVYERA
ncbi:MAG TPA: dihydrofolate reductase [Burkholderiaceae bacterium]|nr:dihydrofolate reductase [Burkholderiaceae bacterium]